MSSQSATGRREAAIAAAAKLGPMRDDVAEAIEVQRQKFAKKRAARNPPERRSEDRRTGPFDRREHETYDRRQGERRQFATMDDKLQAEAKKHAEKRQFTGDPVSQFGGIDK